MNKAKEIRKIADRQGKLILALFALFVVMASWFWIMR